MARTHHPVRSITLLAAALVLLLAACSKSVVVTVPPKVDLKSFPTVGVIEFDVEGTFPLRDDVTHRFLATAQAAQPGVRLLELGTEKEVLAAVGHHQLDFRAVRAIGQEYGVAALLTGQMTVSAVQPSFSVSQATLASLKAQALVNAGLRAKLQETAAGATVWTNGAHGKWSVGGINLDANGASSFGFSDPGQKYEKMLSDLVNVATNDLRPTYERRRVE